MAILLIIKLLRVNIIKESNQIKRFEIRMYKERCLNVEFRELFIIRFIYNEFGIFNYYLTWEITIRDILP